MLQCMKVDMHSRKAIPDPSISLQRVYQWKPQCPKLSQEIREQRIHDLTEEIADLARSIAFKEKRVECKAKRRDLFAELKVFQSKERRSKAYRKSRSRNKSSRECPSSDEEQDRNRNFVRSSLRSPLRSPTPTLSASESEISCIERSSTTYLPSSGTSMMCRSRSTTASPFQLFSPPLKRLKSPPCTSLSPLPLHPESSESLQLSPMTLTFTEEEVQRFEKRLEEGYDIPDQRYTAWLRNNHTAADARHNVDSECTDHQSFPYVTSEATLPSPISQLQPVNPPTHNVTSTVPQSLAQHHFKIGLPVV